MSNEFLERVSAYQGQGMFGNDIKAVGEQLVNQGIKRTTDIVNSAANEMALLSGSKDMRTIDEQIDELSKNADVNQANKNIEELSKNMNLLSNAVAIKKEKYNQFYGSVLNSLSGVGGDASARAMNMIAREQGGTNKELDSKVDEINRGVEYQGALYQLGRGKLIYNKYKYDESRRIDLNKVQESIIADPEFQSMPYMNLSSADEQSLRKYNELISKIVTRHSKATGVDEEITRDALAKLNSFTKLTHDKTPTKISAEEKSRIANDVLYQDAIAELESGTSLYKVIQAYDNKLKASDPDAYGIMDMVRSGYVSSESNSEMGALAKDALSYFGPNGKMSLATSTVKHFDPWGTTKGVPMKEMFREDLDGRALPFDLSEEIDKTSLYNNEAYRGLILEEGNGDILLRDHPYTNIEDVRTRINQAYEDIEKDMNFESESVVATPPLQPSPGLSVLDPGVFQNPYGTQVFGKQAPSSERMKEIEAIQSYNVVARHLDELGFDIRDVPVSKRRVENVKDIKAGMYEDKSNDKVDFNDKDVTSALKESAFFPKQYAGVKQTITNMKKYAKTIDQSVNILDIYDNKDKIFSTAGIDSRLFLISMWAQESQFNPKSVSSSKAKGIGQMFPAAVTDVKREVENFYGKDLTIKDIIEDPDKNMIASTFYAHLQAKRIYNGLGAEYVTIENILMAYSDGYKSVFNYYKGLGNKTDQMRIHPEAVDRYYKFFSSLSN